MIYKLKNGRQNFITFSQREPCCMILQMRLCGLEQMVPKWGFYNIGISLDGVYVGVYLEADFSRSFTFDSYFVFQIVL